VDRPRGGDARGNGMRSAFLQLLGNNIRPVNRHGHQSRRETNINLPPQKATTFHDSKRVKNI
jgi:hypothetical protein